METWILDGERRWWNHFALEEKEDLLGLPGAVCRVLKLVVLGLDLIVWCVSMFFSRLTGCVLSFGDAYIDMAFLFV